MVDLEKWISEIEIGSQRLAEPADDCLDDTGTQQELDSVAHDSGTVHVPVSEIDKLELVALRNKLKVCLAFGSRK